MLFNYGNYNIIKFENDKTLEEIIVNINITNLKVLIYTFFGRKKKVVR